MRWVALIAICGSLGACVCDDAVPRFALIVVVSDADPELTLEAESITVTATDGNFTETYVMADWRSSLTEIDVPFVEGRPGTYDVLVEAPGYRPLLVENVRVREEGFRCKNVETETVHAPLTRIDP